MRAIIGLGNPGKEYEHTRHNVGFLVVDEIARQGGETFTNKSSLEAEITEVRLGDERVLLVKPQTFMNASGRTLSSILSKYPLSIEDVLVVYDDADLPFTDVRFKEGGGTAGHRGIESLQNSLPKGVSLSKIRVGIGRPHHSDVPLDAFVLGRWTKTEEEQIPEIIKGTLQHINTWLE